MPRKYTPEEFVEAFWAKVEFTPTCWIWRGRTVLSRTDRRGTMKVNGKYRYVHQIALEMKLGRRVIKPMQTNHRCDNTICVRNDDDNSHLYEGTSSDNANDREERGRSNHPRGEAHSSAKLTEIQVRIIILSLRVGVKQIVLAKRFNVTDRLIGAIGSRKCWKHLEVVSNFQLQKISEPKR